MTLGCEAASLTNRPLRQSHSHTIKLFYLCQSVSICYYVLPSFLFSRNYIILYSNINITFCYLFVVTVQWSAMWLHTQEWQVQISRIQNSMFSCFICILVFYAIFHFTYILLYSIQHYFTILYVLLYTISYYTLLYYSNIIWQYINVIWEYIDVIWHYINVIW